jgi:hypothetical protein
MGSRFAADFLMAIEQLRACVVVLMPVFEAGVSKESNIFAGAKHKTRVLQRENEKGSRYNGPLLG